MTDALRYLAFAFVGILTAHFAIGAGWGISAFALLVGWPALGTFVTLDDDFADGWSNPDGTEPPPWRTASFWGLLTVGVSISSFVGALETGLQTSGGIKFGLAGAATALLAWFCLRQAYITNMKTATQFEDSRSVDRIEE